MSADSPIPDPNGPPVASPHNREVVRRALSFGVKLFLGTTAGLVILACFPTRTMGALRSQRLKWQERRREITAVQDQEVAPPATQPAEPPHD